MSRIKNKSEAITLKTPNKILGGNVYEVQIISKGWKKLETWQSSL